MTDDLRAQAEANVRAKLPDAYQAMTDGDPTAAARMIMEMARPTKMEVGVTCTLMAEVAAHHLRTVLPASQVDGDYYAFVVVDVETGEAADTDRSALAWASQFVTAACNDDDEQGYALLSSVLESEDSDYAKDCVLTLFLQSWHIITGGTESAQVDLGADGVRDAVTVKSTPTPQEP